MGAEYSSRAISGVLSGSGAFCKFLSANDTGATGGHQSGILVSRSAIALLFGPESIRERILKRTVRIRWQDDFVTESAFTWYESKGELRITRFGRGFPFLKPDQTGTLFVLVRHSREDYCGYFLEAEEDIEAFLDAFGLAPTQTNSLIDTGRIQPRTQEKLAIQEFIDGLREDFPASEEMSAAARRIYEAVYGQSGDGFSGPGPGAGSRMGQARALSGQMEENRNRQKLISPDKSLIEWTNMEYTLFRALEYARYGELIAGGFSSVEEFVRVANMVLNRRKSRAGKSLEHHLCAIFDSRQIAYTAQAVTEGNKRPDFLFPSAEAYHDRSFPVERLTSLAAKTTCKDRWRQVINEADRLKSRPKFLCTLQQGISGAQMDEMQAENVILVVPRPYIRTYPADRQSRIWTVEGFVRYVQEVEDGH